MAYGNKKKKKKKKGGGENARIHPWLSCSHCYSFIGPPSSLNMSYSRILAKDKISNALFNLVAHTCLIHLIRGVPIPVQQRAGSGPTFRNPDAAP